MGLSSLDVPRVVGMATRRRSRGWPTTETHPLRWGTLTAARVCSVLECHGELDAVQDRSATDGDDGLRRTQGVGKGTGVFQCSPLRAAEHRRRLAVAGQGRPAAARSRRVAEPGVSDNHSWCSAKPGCLA